MAAPGIHPTVQKSLALLVRGKLDRREFLRIATLVGCSIPAAFQLAGLPTTANAKNAADRLPFPPDNPKAKSGGILRIAMQVPKIHDPANYAWTEMSNLTRHTLEYLTITGPDNITRPMLAERWEASNNLKTWTFYLRKNVYWHNGEQLEAAHVAWNIHRWLDSSLGSSNIALSTFAAMLVPAKKKDKKNKPVMKPAANAVEILNKHTFRLQLQKPVLSVPEDFYSYPAAILHPSFTPPFWKNPVGTGPYTMEKLQVASKCILSKVTTMTNGKPFEYWGGKTYLDAIHYYHYDQDNQLAALATGEVDAVFSFSAEQIAFAKSFPGRIQSTPTGRTLCCRMRIDQKPFDNPLLRRALAAATDANEIRRLIFREGGATGENHHVAPLHPEYFRLPKKARDTEKAKALLTQAGFPNGLSLTIAVGNTDGPWQQTICEALRDQWKAIGVTLNIQVMPASKYWEVWKKVPFGATSWTHRPLGTMTLSLAYRAASPWNECRYDNPAFERALDEAETHVDPAKRRAKMEAVEKNLQDAAVIIQPVWRPTYMMNAPDVHGFDVHPTQYHQLNKVWLA